jgi:hypothetical protein
MAAGVDVPLIGVVVAPNALGAGICPIRVGPPKATPFGMAAGVDVPLIGVVVAPNALGGILYIYIYIYKKNI